jgi:hypothetical protein
MFRASATGEGISPSRHSTAESQASRNQRSVERAAIATSTIGSEKRLQEVMETLKKASVQDPNHVVTDLKNATDDYARTVRELNSHYPTT